MARKKKAGKRRGGRKPGTWSLLQPEALRSWRKKNNASRARVAELLGVSSTSVQNWETGHAVANPKMQQRLLELTSGAAERPLAKNAPKTRDRGSASAVSASTADGSIVQVTGAIIVEVVRSSAKKDFTPEAIGSLIRTVREALS